jgi:hypothetical protein
MDPITAAIIAAAAAGVASGTGEVGQQAVHDAYNGLKALLKQKFGAASDLAEAVDKVEQKPDSEGRRAMLQEEVVTAQAHQDPELKQVAETLLAQMEQEPQLAHYVKQIAVGSYIAQASHGGTASINVNAKED